MQQVWSHVEACLLPHRVTALMLQTKPWSIYLSLVTFFHHLWTRYFTLLLEAGTHPQSRGSNPCFSGQKACPLDLDKLTFIPASSFLPFESAQCELKVSLKPTVELHNLYNLTAPKPNILLFTTTPPDLFPGHHKHLRGSPGGVQLALRMSLSLWKECSYWFGCIKSN